MVLIKLYKFREKIRRDFETTMVKTVVPLRESEIILAPAVVKNSKGLIF